VQDKNQQKNDKKENLEELERFSKKRKLQNKILLKMIEKLSQQKSNTPKK
jgi:hypothetical protein